MAPRALQALNQIKFLWMQHPKTRRAVWPSDLGPSPGLLPVLGPGAAGGKRVAKKILAKSGDAAFQYEIMKDEAHVLPRVSAESSILPVPTCITGNGAVS